MDDETTDAPEAPPSETEEPRESVSLETALTWLAQIRPAPVLALLREPDFALVSVTAFAGFRVNATGYANPLVRKRLAQEAVREEKFAEKLRELAEQAAPPSPAKSAPAPKTPPVTGKDEAARADALRADRDRRRRERDEARQALAEARTARGEAEAAQRHAEQERDEAIRLAQRHGQRIERLERQAARLQAEQAGLLRALRQQTHGKELSPTKEAPPAPNKGGAGGDNPFPAPQDWGGGAASGRTSPWQEAVAHLLHKRKFDMALGLAEDVLRANPEEADALDIAARAHEGREEARLSVPLLRRLLAVRLARGSISQAGETLLRLLRLAAPSEAERDVRAFLAALRPEDSAAVEQTRSVLARLRGLSPDAFEALAAQIRSVASPNLTEALMPTPGRAGQDDALLLPTAPTLTARQLLRAIDIGDQDTVAQARAALFQLCESDPAAQTRLRQTLEWAVGDDETYLTTLFGRPRGPVIVDGSNVAWHDQNLLTAGRPRLRPLQGIRRALRGQGYFPILLYADAPLPYTIDEPEALRQMAAQGEITIVDSGVDADEVLLRAAKHWDAPLVTNDRMNDWDPLHTVPKIRYAIAANGAAYLLPESD